MRDAFFCIKRGLLVGGDGDMYLGGVAGDVAVVAGEDGLGGAGEVGAA